MDARHNRRSLTRPTGKRDALIWQLLEGLPLAGVERSFRLRPGGVDSNRFLAGMPCDQVDKNTIATICREMGMPASHRQSFYDHLAEANQVLIGFEGDDRRCVYKVYLEFWDRLVQDLRANPRYRDPTLLHIGYKWDPGNPVTSAVTRYICYPMLPPSVIRVRLQELCEGADPRLMATTLEILDIACERIGPADAPIYVEAEEDGNPRHSFDLNLYKAELKMGSIAPLLAPLASVLDVSPPSYTSVVDNIADHPFGHLAGGRDREGHTFCTAYYEV